MEGAKTSPPLKSPIHDSEIPDLVTDDSSSGAETEDSDYRDCAERYGYGQSDTDSDQKTTQEWAAPVKPVKATQDPDSRSELKELLAEGQRWHTSGHSAKALSSFQGALRLITKRDIKLSAADSRALNFLLLDCAVDSSSKTKEVLAAHRGELKSLRDEFRKFGETQPFFLDLIEAKIIVKEQNYHSTFILDQLKCLDESNQNNSVLHYPLKEESKTVVDVTKKSHFKEAMELLQEESAKAYKERQKFFRFKCQYKQCSYPNQESYSDDLDFEGAQEINCSKDCTLFFHFRCFKDYEKGDGVVSGKHKKEKKSVIHAECPGSNGACGGRVNRVQKRDAAWKIKDVQEAKCQFNRDWSSLMNEVCEPQKNRSRNPSKTSSVTTAESDSRESGSNCHESETDATSSMAQSEVVGDFGNLMIDQINVRTDIPAVPLDRKDDLDELASTQSKKSKKKKKPKKTIQTVELPPDPRSAKGTSSQSEKLKLKSKASTNLRQHLNLGPEQRIPDPLPSVILNFLSRLTQYLEWMRVPLNPDEDHGIQSMLWEDPTLSEALCPILGEDMNFLTFLQYQISPLKFKVSHTENTIALESYTEPGMTSIPESSSTTNQRSPVRSPAVARTSRNPSGNSNTSSSSSSPTSAVRSRLANLPAPAGLDALADGLLGITRKPPVADPPAPIIEEEAEKKPSKKTAAKKKTKSTPAITSPKVDSPSPKKKPNETRIEKTRRLMASTLGPLNGIPGLCNDGSGQRLFTEIVTMYLSEKGLQFKEVARNPPEEVAKQFLIYFNEKECPICLERMERTPAPSAVKGHCANTFYHRNCFDEALKQDAKCPTCRTHCLSDTDFPSLK